MRRQRGNGKVEDKRFQPAPRASDTFTSAVLCASRHVAPPVRQTRISAARGESVLARPRCGDSRPGAFSCVNFAPSSRPLHPAPVPPPYFPVAKREGLPSAAHHGRIDSRSSSTRHTRAGERASLVTTTIAEPALTIGPCSPLARLLDPFRPSPSTVVLPIAEGLFLAARRRFSARLVVVATIGEAESVV